MKGRETKEKREWEAPVFAGVGKPGDDSEKYASTGKLTGQESYTLRDSELGWRRRFSRLRLDGG